MSIYRKFTLEEIHSWPEIHPDHEMKILQLLLNKLEDEEQYEECIVVYNRMETHRGNNNLQSTYQ